MRPRLLPSVVVLLTALAGCGGGGGDNAPRDNGPVLGRATSTATPQGGDATPQPAAQGAPVGFPIIATKNTTRVPGADPASDAAAVAEAVYPALTPENRPQAVVLADEKDWRAAISAAQLMGRPLRAPILLADGDTLPPVTAQALKDLAPTGAAKAGGAQVIRIGSVPKPDGLKSIEVGGGSSEAIAHAIDRLQSRAAGGASDTVVVAPSDRAPLAMPTASWAAKSGQPVLWAGKSTLPRDTVAAIRAHKRPRIYVVGPPEAISDGVLKQLRNLGAVKRIGTSDPVTNAIFLARYADGTFGWNVVDPGHGLVFANASRTADAAAAAALSGAGTYGPLLLVSEASALPKDVQDYLLDIQPGYDKDPVRGVYNHGWLVGDESAISADVQSRIDALLEIQPVDTGGA
jgi:Cell wall binding domain 2 (CWB2)